MTQMRPDSQLAYDVALDTTPQFTAAVSHMDSIPTPQDIAAVSYMTSDTTLHDTITMSHMALETQQDPTAISTVYTPFPVTGLEATPMSQGGSGS